MVTESVGARVRRLRRARVLTIKELADLAGMRRWKTLQEIERGYQQPRPSTLRRVAAGLGVEPTELVA